MAQRATDIRSPEASAYRPLYKSRQWARYSNGQLVGGLKFQAHLRDLWKCQRPGCGVITMPGRDSPRSAVAHHKEAHKGDPALFYDLDNIETVCKACHDGALQSTERLGYSTEIGPDGWPTDPEHPANR